LNCVWCAIRKDKTLHTRGGGYLTAENFKKFLSAHPYIKEIEISNQGEVFLNPEIADIFRIAFESGVQITILNGTNFNDVSDEALDALAKYQVHGMNVAIDGASQETYSKYRRGGNFDKVILNIKKLNERRKSHAKKSWLAAGIPPLPWVAWQYVILPTNCDISEIRRAKEMARELEINIVFFPDAWRGFIPPNREQVERETGLDYSKTKDARKILCRQMWNNPQINWDGRFYGCACNSFGEFGGNVFTDGLAACMKGKLFLGTKRMLMGGRVAQGSPCLRCGVYKEMAKTKDWIKKDDI
jgi:hypothetical protein